MVGLYIYDNLETIAET